MRIDSRGVESNVSLPVVVTNRIESANVQPQRVEPEVVSTAAPMATLSQPTNAPSVVVKPSPTIVPFTAPKLEEPPANCPPGYPRPVTDLLEAQIALARRRLSPGSLDGLSGPQTRAALKAFQAQQGLPATGELNEATRQRLQLNEPPFATVAVRLADLQRLQPVSASWLGKSQQSALDYETLLELIAEKTQSHPNLIRKLNPGIQWTNVAEGTLVKSPALGKVPSKTKAAWVTISLSGKVLQAFDDGTNLLAHFPCSIAQRVEKRPVGELTVVSIAPDPNYTFDPGVFPESAEARSLKTKLLLPPGPNNPVGVAWIGLDRPGYGIHGTPNPEQVGRTESHGCFRLANWNAAALIDLVWVGMPVVVEP